VVQNYFGVDTYSGVGFGDIQARSAVGNAREANAFGVFEVIRGEVVMMLDCSALGSWCLSAA
jgi:hypothetical protein